MNWSIARRITSESEIPVCSAIDFRAAICLSERKKLRRFILEAAPNNLQRVMFDDASALVANIAT